MQWRIHEFPEGVPTPEGRTLTYYLTNFPQKLHENEGVNGSKEYAGVVPWTGLAIVMSHKRHSKRQRKLHYQFRKL